MRERILKLWRWGALAVAMSLLVAAGFLWGRSDPHARAARLIGTSPAAAQGIPAPADDAAPLVAPVSDVAPMDKEAKRFHRYDKDRNGSISRDEYFTARHKAFAKLDTNGDGKLSFEEYSVKAIAKFNGADANRDGVLTPKEFATTAVVHKPRNKPVCPPGVIAAAAAAAEGEN